MMKALLLCGGFATRLEPITYFIPKQLLPIGIGGKPVIEYVLDGVVSAGIGDIILSTNTKFHNQFEYWVKHRLTNRNITVKFVIEKATKNEEKFGAIKGIVYAIEKEKINSDLMVILGDNLYDFKIKEIIDYFNKHRKPTIALYDVGSKETAKRFGVAELIGDRVASITEKPQDPKTTLVSTGIYLFPKDGLANFSEYISGNNNPDAPGHFMSWLVKKTEVKGYVYKGRWWDIGTLETYKKVFDEFNHKDKIS